MYMKPLHTVGSPTGRGEHCGYMHVHAGTLGASETVTL